MYVIPIRSKYYVKIMKFNPIRFWCSHTKTRSLWIFCAKSFSLLICVRQQPIYSLFICFLHTCSLYSDVFFDILDGILAVRSDQILFSHDVTKINQTADPFSWSYPVNHTLQIWISFLREKFTLQKTSQPDLEAVQTKVWLSVKKLCIYTLLRYP